VSTIECREITVHANGNAIRCFLPYRVSPVTMLDIDTVDHRH